MWYLVTALDGKIIDQSPVEILDPEMPIFEIDEDGNFVEAYWHNSEENQCTPHY